VPAPVLRHLEGVAAAVGVNVQRAVLTRGDNDATAMAWAAPGTLAASISIPRRYAHTGVEVARTADIAVTYALLEALVLTPWTGAAPAGAPHISPSTRRNT
jgi:putative aminopeptidase FrvX